jgi:hypothetical protein
MVDVDADHMGLIGASALAHGFSQPERQAMACRGWYCEDCRSKSNSQVPRRGTETILKRSSRTQCSWEECIWRV